MTDPNDWLDEGSDRVLFWFLVWFWSVVMLGFAGACVVVWWVE